MMAQIREAQEYPPFDFNTSEIEKHEGCTDSVVYPGGYSGPTISCGLDLGNIGSYNASKVLRGVVSDSIYDILMDGTSVRGEASKYWIKKHQVHIGRHDAILICNRVKMLFWNALNSRYPNIVNAPGVVKSAMLDIAFQAGVGSKRMDGLGYPISVGDWNSVGVIIENSYNDFQDGDYNAIYLRKVSHGKRIQYMVHPPNHLIDPD
jgi:hypothetical protein